MLFHVSIAAYDPRHVAEVLAELWAGDALFFLPVSDNGWIVLARDEHRSALEVYPIDTVLREGLCQTKRTGSASGRRLVHCRVLQLLSEG